MSRPIRTIRVCVLLVPFGALALGCGGKPSVSSSTTECTVRGTVTIAGERANGGTIIFDPSNYQRKMVQARNAPISEDGTYEITTLVGLNTIQIAGPQAGAVGAEYQMIDYDAKAGEQTYDVVFEAGEGY